MNTTHQPAPARTAIRKPGRDGAGLIFTLVFVAATGIVTGALLNAAVTHRKIASKTFYRERALYVAESGFERMAQHVQNQGGILPASFTTNGTLDGFAWSCSAQKLGEFQFKVDSTATVQNVKWCVHASRLEVPTWAQYALWMHENGVIYFFGGEEFYGWVHSNDKLWFSPVGGVGAYFYDKVTSASNTYGGSTSGAYFAQGFQLNAEQDTMATVDFAALKTAATSYGNVLSGNTIITFTGSQMRVTNARAGWTNYSLAIGTNKVIYIQNATTSPSSTQPATLVVAGKVDGRVTIATEDDITITNHITYASDPRTNSSSDDALGLVSKDDIWIATNAPNNLKIFAAMMASGQITNDSGSFGAINYNTGSPRGDLTVWGSIVQEKRGAVNTTGGSGLATGYAKDYGYDSRFLASAPPFYPRLTTKIIFSGWREGPN